MQLARIKPAKKGHNLAQSRAFYVETRPDGFYIIGAWGQEHGPFYFIQTAAKVCQGLNKGGAI